MSKIIDMTGLKIGHWTVLGRDYSKTGGNAYWLCECDCGNEKIFSIRGADLRRGKTTNCGCIKKIKCQNTGEDLTGQRFGKLIVLKMGEKKNGNRHRHWICQCDCGNITNPIPSDNLKSGNTTSCGCQLSKGEFKIEQFLKNLNISYEKEKTFSNLKGDNKPLRFDFYLKDFNTVIEYQGIQHYQPREQFGGEEQYKKQLIYDQLKKQYCQNHSINFIEISYLDYSQIEEKLTKAIDFLTKI